MLRIIVKSVEVGDGRFFETGTAGVKNIEERLDEGAFTYVVFYYESNLIVRLFNPVIVQYVQIDD